MRTPYQDWNLINFIPDIPFETTATASVVRYGVGDCDVNFVSDCKMLLSQQEMISSL